MTVPEPVELTRTTSRSEILKSDDTCAMIIGHRGYRANRSPDENVRENTVHSLHEGHRAGASFVEFDVQITSDGVPVLWHDDSVTTLVNNSEVISREVSELTLAEFRTVTSGRSVSHGGQEHQLVRQFKCQRGMEDAQPLPWTCPEDQHSNPATLQEALVGTPNDLGFNIELKFDSVRSSTVEERMAHLSTVLRVVNDFASDRPILFSSFDVDACLEAKSMQDCYPVFLLTCMEKEHHDPRRHSLKAAVDVVLGGELDGVVAYSTYLFEETEQIARLKQADLPLFTYGEANCDPAVVAAQIHAGATGVITDSIQRCKDTLRCLEEDRFSYPQVSVAAKQAVTAAA
eukprot:CAMPEP_0118924024 /NCGR_PEP_ID=MMETSP1169-20130426/2335_1 /TAXON_ID=36882 /ORGANISM="Pyramimonas obovata, Strain CCMP722" /LENGTH=344 /DNA_ID=CAMNT_0006865101 /DNA_START=317 /DNA_END=1354 /DNA_ORIENTATION=-